ncbi:hypothetical protein [Niveispirillum sp. KHB5.9]|uniref:hypothetical protein n=1 Tax=Niveispirillum sp. KHB5.9 TaxID=3400269 RepID=UPI003A85D312
MNKFLFSLALTASLLTATAAQARNSEDPLFAPEVAEPTVTPVTAPESRAVQSLLDNLVSAEAAGDAVNAKRWAELVAAERTNEAVVQVAEKAE